MPERAPVRPAVERIFLVGLSGSGKSTVGRLVAELLGWEFVDTDRLVEELEGRSIPEIIGTERENESRFRELEAAALRELAGRQSVVVATGGGAPTHAASRAAIASGLVVWLDVSPEMAAKRLSADPLTETRPMLAGDIAGRLASLHEQRRPLYEQSDHSIAVDFYTPQQVAERIVELVHGGREVGTDKGQQRFQGDARPSVAAVVQTRPDATIYPIVVEDGALSMLGEVCREAGLTGRAFLLIDAAIASSYGSPVRESLERSGFAVCERAIPATEAVKSLDTVAIVWDWLLAERVERRDFLVCVGGGVLTDLGGFAAATILRGIPFIHVPTTLLGMVDAAIGGKTGVDHPLGKNMIGAFAQPRAVVMDPQVLATLPDREMRAGWAEVLKHGLILDATLFGELERMAGDAAAMRSARLIGWSAAIKAEIVSGDEREAGARTLLNYGHTIGHAIENVTGYERYLHGEAVAIGMRAAGIIGVRLGVFPVADFERQQRAIRACGLPETAQGLDVDAVLAAVSGDKKSRGGSVQWVLLRRIGDAYLHGAVPPDVVREAVAAVCT